MPVQGSAATGSACGKIILSGEYAVVFGKPGIAIPSKERIEVAWTDDESEPGPAILWEEAAAGPEWRTYTKKILSLLELHTGPLRGVLDVKNTIPLGKGMGSSTALVIALCRCFLGPEFPKPALAVENEMTPGNSGLDFAVIWEEKPILFQKDREPNRVDLPQGLETMELIDTGTPNETTAELLVWIKDRYRTDPVVKEAIDVIGTCTERVLNGEDLKTVMRDHHRAQIALGVVPEATQKLIEDIEVAGGAAKVIGAGARTGGGGMVLALR